MLEKLPEVDKLEDEDVRNALLNIGENAMGNPVKFSSAPTLGGMKANTWGFYSTDVYIKASDGTGIKISGAAFT